jgi:ATP-binding cassette, subfamily B, bacterial
VIKGPIAHGDLHGILVGTLGFAALAIVTDGMFHFRQRYALEIGETVVNGLRSDIFEKTQRQPMSFFHRMKLGRILSRVTSDVEAVRVGIQDVGFVSAIQFGQMVFAAVVLTSRLEDVPRRRGHGAGPVGVNNHFRMKLSRLTRASQESFSRVTATTRGVGERDPRDPGLRPAGHERRPLQEPPLRPLEVQHRARADLGGAGADPRAEQPVLRRDPPHRRRLARLPPRMQADDLIMFFLLANIFFSPITIIGNQYNQGLLAMAGAERIFRLIDTPPDWEDAPDAPDLPDPEGGRGAARGSGARVEFRASPSATIRRGSSCTTSTSRRSRADVALVGHTGSGKSSIINLVSKFYLPTRGEVLVDGREIRPSPAARCTARWGWSSSRTSSSAARCSRTSA